MQANTPQRDTRNAEHHTCAARAHGHAATESNSDNPTQTHENKRISLSVPYVWPSGHVLNWLRGVSRLAKASRSPPPDPQPGRVAEGS